MIDLPINTPPKAPEPEVPPRAPSEVHENAVTGDIKARWKRFQKHHRLASAASGNAFTHLVFAGVEVVLLKAATQHGEFWAQVAAKVKGIATRTITRYRRVGEQFLSAVHQEPVSARKLHAHEQSIHLAYCTDEFILSYLRQHSLNTTEDLAKHAKSKLPQPAAASTKVAQAPALKVRYKVERVLKRMSQAERNQVWQELDLLRATFNPQETADPEITSLQNQEQPTLT
jgi:hypothetical protein